MSPRKHDAKLEATRKEALVRAGYAAVVEKGLEGLTVETTAQRAGSSKGGALYYFPKKEDLMVGILEWVLNQVGKNLDEAVAAQSNPRAKLAAELELLFHSAELNRKFYSVFLDYLSAGSRNKTFTKLLEQFYRKCHERDRKIIEDGIQQRQLRNVNPDDAANLFRAVVDGLCIQWLMAKTGTPIEPFHQQCRAALGSYLIR